MHLLPILSCDSVYCTIMSNAAMQRPAEYASYCLHNRVAASGSFMSQTTPFGWHDSTTSERITRKASASTTERHAGAAVQPLRAVM